MSEMPDSTLDALTKGPEGIHHHDGFTMAVGPEAVGLVRLVAIRTRRGVRGDFLPNNRHGLFDDQLPDPVLV